MKSNIKSLFLQALSTELHGKKATQIIEHYGGRVKGGMSGFIDYLIVGDKPGIKLQKAKYHPFVRIIQQKEFFKDERISEFLSKEELESI